jgi:molybdenum cofactor biosynthesis enzyme MoaA
MPNIIINNYCNQKCEYCFAENNMSISTKKEMSIITFIKVLKYLKFNEEKEVRILGGEPLLAKNIRKFILLSTKG